MTRRFWCLAAAMSAWAAGAAGGQPQIQGQPQLQSQSVVGTVHNLSASGPGQIRAASEEQVCIFCHTPHGASAQRPLWNRQAHLGPYTVYTSDSLDAEPGQPTGASKMCLSCHDGTIALGSVISQDQIIKMAGGITTLPPGDSNLGTDLSDDHPVSFRYTTDLAAKDGRLADPHGLPPAVRLDDNREMQCTTCHDPHNNTYGDFLVMENSGSTLCMTCHTISATTIAAHEDCASCHTSHSAPSGPFLLRGATSSETCFRCHDGTQPRAANIEAEMQRLSVHNTNGPVDGPDRIPGHSSCSDCHEPHSMMEGSDSAPAVSPAQGQITGVSGGGAPVARASFGYEVCYKCHASENAVHTTWVSRQLTQLNTALEFDQSAVSFHPVEASGRNPDVPSLKRPLTESSIIACSDCHGSDTSRKAGGSGPNGVHGSNQAPLLLAGYETLDYTPESTRAYGLCYLCHERDGAGGIMSDRSFPHQVHVIDSRTPCSACHDAHGISSAQGNRMQNSHLINFDISIVFPNQSNGRLEFKDLGVFQGSCTLSCHGVTHDQTEYAR